MRIYQQLRVQLLQETLSASIRSIITSFTAWCVPRQITAVDAAELGFAGVGVTISDTDLAWLYNLITAAASRPIQDAITREVAAQVCARACAV